MFLLKRIQPGKFRSFTSRNIIMILVSMLYLIISLILVAGQNYIVWLITPALFIIALAFISIDSFFLLLLFLTPLSIQLRFLAPALPFDLFLPTEAMLGLLLIIVLYKLIVAKEFSLGLLKHPLSIAVYLSLIWMFITSLTGTNILVSLKYTLVRIWFIAGFYILTLELGRNASFRKMALIALVAGMVPVIIFHMFILSKSGLFNRYAAHGATWPFFNDHTSFGAAIAFIAPVVLWLSLTSGKIRLRVLYFIVFLIFLCGLLFSYSRAAWISLAIAALFSLVYLLRISWKIAGLSALGLSLIIVFSWSSIIGKLESNTQDSSANIKEHIQSIYNIRSDASNLERINRWKSALRMAEERPILGWGPGTYQFEYAPYQFSHERTVISTNFGDGGNAHSEYLGLLADSGFLAPILYIIILILAFRSGYRAYLHADSRESRGLAIALMSGLITYVVHGALNNFLDTDKISAPFWIFISCLLVLDKYSERPA